MAEEAPERTPPGARWMVVETDEQCGLAGVQARALAGGGAGRFGEAVWERFEKFERLTFVSAIAGMRGRL